MKQRMACIVLTDLRDGIGRPTIVETADLLLAVGVLAGHRSKAIAAVDAMVDKGHRYRNLHQNVCTGLALVLGIGLPEHW